MPMISVERMSQIGSILKRPSSPLPGVSFVKVASRPTVVVRESRYCDLTDAVYLLESGATITRTRLVHLLEAGFTGTLIDSLGREYYFQDGKRIGGAAAAQTGHLYKFPEKDRRKAHAALKAVVNKKAITPEHLDQLHEHIVALTVPELKKARAMLALNFKGVTRKDQMVAAIRAHVRGILEKQMADEGKVLPAAPPPSTPGVEEYTSGVKTIEDKTSGTISIKFPHKPTPGVVDRLGKASFKYSEDTGMWSRRLSPHSVIATKTLLTELGHRQTDRHSNLLPVKPKPKKDWSADLKEKPKG